LRLAHFSHFSACAFSPFSTGAFYLFGRAGFIGHLSKKA
jgi:hypothetical protein